MRPFFNKSFIILTLFLLIFITHQFSLFSKEEDDKSQSKKVIFSESKESIVSYKNFESYNEQNVIRITFTEAFDEINAKTSSDATELIFEGWSADGRMGIYSISNNNNQNRNVIFKNFKTSTNPVFDQKNKNVYFTSSHDKKGTKNGALLKIDKSGIGGLHIIPTVNEGIINSLAVSANGEIAISQITTRGTLIQLINLESNFHSELIIGDEVNWSADSNKIIFTAKDFSDIRSIFTINKDGSNLTQLTSFSEDVSSPSFSPDGNWICFAGLSKPSTTIKKEESSNWDIFMMKNDGTKLIQLTKDLAADKSPFWANDGSIYFSSNRFGNYEILKISPNLK